MKGTQKVTPKALANTFGVLQLTAPAIPQGNNPALRLANAMGVRIIPAADR